LEAASGFFALTLPQARAIIKGVATATATWRDAAKAIRARASEINRMAGAFEHDDLRRALAL
jgi:serine/threonine-protein kinase HipA